MARFPRNRALTTMALAALLGAGGATVAATPAPAANRLVARLHAHGHHPRAGRAWPIRITARTPSGKPVRAHVRYEFLYQGQVVARRSNYRFRGTFRDNILWPARAAGMRLTFRAVVTSRIGRRNLDRWVKVRR